MDIQTLRNLEFRERNQRAVPSQSMVSTSRDLTMCSQFFNRNCADFPFVVNRKSCYFNWSENLVYQKSSVPKI